MTNNKELINEYVLRSKDIPLVKFSLFKEIETTEGVIQETYKIQIEKKFEENKHLFPKNLNFNFDAAQLEKWINNRKAPKNRQFVNKITMSIEDNKNPLKYVDITHALSLNDAYWITNNLTNHKWKNFNLYKNKFDEILAYVAFTGYSQKVSGLITTPELTSGGALKKCWSNRSDGIYLIKGDDFAPKKDKRSQVTNEYYASQVAEIMGLNYIPYDLEEFKHKDGTKEIVCKCKLFTSEDIGYIDAHTYLKLCGISDTENEMKTLNGQINAAKLFGKEAYEDMMLFDTIIGNRDRHLGNFGMLVDNNTGEILKMAPIFDNGLSMLYGAAAMDLLPKYIEGYKMSLGCNYLSFDIQAQLFVQERHIKKLKKLNNFKFVRHPKFNIEESTLKLMEDFIKERAKKALELYKEKEKNLKKLLNPN